MNNSETNRLDYLLFGQRNASMPLLKEKRPSSYQQKEDMKLDLLAYAPCTLKQGFRAAVDRIAVEKMITQGRKVRYHVPLGCAASQEYDLIWKNEHLEELPDVIISIGFGDFFRPEFCRNHIDNGNFHAVLPVKINPAFVRGGIIDPKNNYTVYSGQTYLMLVDRTRLGDLPVPKLWGDLLNPAYKDNIIIGGSRDELSEILLMSIYKDFGEEGVRQLSANVKDIWHCSEMSKYAGSGSEKGAAIYVISSFFASATPERASVEFVIPEEGMIMSPLYLLMKKDAAEMQKEFSDYLLGKEFGTILSEASYPVLNGDVAPSRFSSAALKWVGWDFIRSNDMYALREHLSTLFHSVYDLRRG